MKKSVIRTVLFLLAVAGMAISCQYREYAPADYPSNVVYQPMAKIDGGIWYINGPDEGDAKYFLDKSSGKFIINMGVVQSGINLRQGTVNIFPEASLVNRYIMDGTFEPSTVTLPQNAYSLPESVTMSPEDAGVAFTLSINYNIFLVDEYMGKKIGIAVKIRSDDFEVSPTFSTVVILLDPSYLVL